LSAQHSRFTLHPPVRDGIIQFARHTAQADGVWHVARIEMPNAARERIFRTLRLLGLTKADITPGLDSLAHDILLRMEFGDRDLDRAIREDRIGRETAGSA
jgi:hypothetical protein